MTLKAFKQGALTGLCGPFAILNALARLGPDLLPGGAPADLARAFIAALPGVTLASVIREGTDRAQMDLMLDAARSASRRAWSFEAAHPGPGESAQAFWSRVAAASDAAAIIGFGDDDRPGTIYEPHWTCVGGITPTRVVLADSDEYETLRRDRTGIRPEPGWEIEDCYLLRRAA